MILESNDIQAKQGQSKGSMNTIIWLLHVYFHYRNMLHRQRKDAEATLYTTFNDLNKSNIHKVD